MTDTSVSGTEASKQLPSGASNGQVPIWNSTTNRWEAGSNAAFDPTADITFSGIVSFTGSTTVKHDLFFISNGTNTLSFDVSQLGANATLIVPVTVGSIIATQDSNNNFSVAQTFQQNINASKALVVAASEGNGYIQFGQQSITPAGVANTLTMYCDSTTNGRLALRHGTGFTATIETSTITANRRYTFPDANCTLAGLEVAQTFSATQKFGTATDYTQIAGNALTFFVSSATTLAIVPNPSTATFRWNGTTIFSVGTSTVTMNTGSIFITAASATGGAGFRIPAGTAPTSPVNGDMWLQTDDILSIRINGVTKRFTLTLP